MHRLVLADALHYVSKFNPARIIDLATLTGACMVALGPHTTGLFSNNDALALDLITASKRAGEDFWRMPLTPVLKDQLKSEVADMRNTGERYGGAITASLFLKEFVGETPWAHLDIAGPATTTDDSGAQSKGGTGVGVATLVEFLSTQS
jgi:leucyl aminopeptidase